jgi:hypothetical protein
MQTADGKPIDLTRERDYLVLTDAGPRRCSTSQPNRRPRQLRRAASWGGPSQYPAGNEDALQRCIELTNSLREAK